VVCTAAWACMRPRCCWRKRLYWCCCSSDWAALRWALAYDVPAAVEELVTRPGLAVSPRRMHTVHLLQEMFTLPLRSTYRDKRVWLAARRRAVNALLTHPSLRRPGVAELISLQSVMDVADTRVWDTLVSLHASALSMSSLVS
jgi:hypothetical protein